MRRPATHPGRYAFWWLALATLLPLWGYLLLAGPQYEPDLHYYLTGALHWHPLHPPGTNMFLSVCHRLWPSAYLPVLLQTLAFALCLAALLHYGLRLRGWVALLPSLWLGLDPLPAYLLLSLQSEALFMASLLLLLTALLRRAPAWQLGLLLGLAFLFRYQALFSLPAVAVWVGLRSWRARSGVGHSLALLLLPLGLVVGIEQLGHRLQGHHHYPVQGKRLWDNASALAPEQAAPGPLARLLRQQRDSLERVRPGHWQRYPRARYQLGEWALHLRRSQLIARGQSPAQAWQQADAELAALTPYPPLQVHGQLLADNLRALYRHPWLEYRHLPAYRPVQAAEYRELDQLVYRLYGYRQQLARQPAPWQRASWQRLALGMYTLVALLLVALGCWRRALRAPTGFVLLPLALLLLGVPIQPRFVLVYGPVLVALAAAQYARRCNRRDVAAGYRPVNLL
ncbi:MAG: hypothetical protein ACK5XP_06970 [Sphingobacteriia bacterium]